MKQHSLPKQTSSTDRSVTSQSIMMKSVVFLLVLVAVVSSNEYDNFLAGGDEGEGNFLAGGDDGEGNFLAGSDDGEGNFFAAGDESESDFIANSVDGDYFTATRDFLYDPITAMETELPTRMARSNLTVGSICSSCRVLFRSNPKIAGKAGQVRVRYVTFFRPGVRISAVRANRIGSETARPRITAGGIGKNKVIVMFSSLVGQGFEYALQIWGRNK